MSVSTITIRNLKVPLSAIQKYITPYDDTQIDTSDPTILDVSYYDNVERANRMLLRLQKAGFDASIDHDFEDDERPIEQVVLTIQSNFPGDILRDMIRPITSEDLTMIGKDHYEILADSSLIKSLPNNLFINIQKKNDKRNIDIDSMLSDKMKRTRI